MRSLENRPDLSSSSEEKHSAYCWYEIFRGWIPFLSSS